MNRSTVQKRLTSYTAAQDRLNLSRINLRAAVKDWHEAGATIVEIADTLGRSRQSVYDLIGK
jgi:IS30 family transposase